MKNFEKSRGVEIHFRQLLFKQSYFFHHSSTLPFKCRKEIIVLTKNNLTKVE